MMRSTARVTFEKFQIKNMRTLRTFEVSFLAWSAIDFPFEGHFFPSVGQLPRFISRQMAFDFVDICEA